jgi:serine/threonine protein kinase/Tol biopolymer transport system component
MPDNWNRAKDVFHEALKQPAAGRRRFVADSCGDDAGLRAQVEELLAGHEAAGDFLALPATAPGAGTGRIHEAPGTEVGPYKLLQLIGEGGFGEVYMAEQEQPIRRRVALKIIKLGMNTRDVIARFESERQALAMMDHPNIAKVFDAGATASGRPYFVMELVRGVPITDYCDAGKLSTRERLDLFVQVCKAVHHAHEKGIIHRDIKPSNVMVTLHDGTPVPKVIDFGVAKATNQRLTEKTLFTAYGTAVGTPAYMSPEQAEMSGLDVDRRSDIYSLGVLLYELLTGTTPLDATRLRSAAFQELQRIIREEDPPTPSSRLSTLGDQLAEIATKRGADPEVLRKMVRGDLDWIVMKTIEKDRRRRYDTASELIADVSRYFKDEAVTARRPSAAYRLGKFAKRHRGPLIAAAGIVVALLAGTAIAQLGGFGGAAAAGAPARRLVFDQTRNPFSIEVTANGRDRLRFNVERLGYEIVDESGKARVLTSGGRLPGNLPQPPYPNLFPNHSLSPDQKLIAAVVASKDGGFELRLLPVGSVGEGRLVTQWGLHHTVKIFGWSPDQSRLWVFILRSHDRSADIASVDLTSGAVQIRMTLAKRMHTQPPSLSPDGRWIAYHDGETLEGPADIFVMPASDGEAVRIQHPANDSKPLFTPDGSGVVFHSTRHGGDLWFQPLSGGRPSGEPRAVWDDIGLFGSATGFTENGSLNYYFATNGFEVYTVPLDVAHGTVGAVQLLEPRPGEMNNAPAYSPDGRALAHLRNAGRRLVLRDLASNTEREFPIPSTVAPRLIAFCGTRSVLLAGSGSGIYRVPLDRGGVEPIVTEAAYGIGCSDDGRDIVYIPGRGFPAPVGRGVIRRSLATGKETALYDGMAAHLQRSPDGRRVAFVQVGETEAQLVVMPVEGGTPVVVATSPVGTRRVVDFHGTTWLADGTGLLVARSNAAEMVKSDPEITLWRIPLDGAPAVEAGRFRLPAFDRAIIGSFNYSLHPGGTRLAFERHTGFVAQVWAIDHLMAFIKSGASVTAVPRR